MPWADLGLVLVSHQRDRQTSPDAYFETESVRQDSLFAVVMVVFLEECCLVRNHSGRSCFGERASG